MADYAIGDIHGCFDPLKRLLDHIHFDDKKDTLWLVGDLVNRGPQSLEVLRFLKSLKIAPNITLGNHDLYLLNRLFCNQNAWLDKEDTLTPILKASDGEELGHWLRKQSMICYSSQLSVIMVHAGIAPFWNLSEALHFGGELESALRAPNFRELLMQIYGNEPNYWSHELTGIERLRVITNYFTRMRFCDADGRLYFDYVGTVEKAPSHYHPWFSMTKRTPIEADLIFGHWATLMGQCPTPKVYALDTGCVWGGQLTALRLQDRKRFSVQGLASF
jgi:bis(5'-nucleosyl)-tetraphosphatase (symmetrical)